MIIKVTQTSRELYESKFVIKSGEKILGEAAVKGRIGSMEGTVTLNMEGSQIVMDRAKIGRFVDGDKPFRPYQISLNGQPAGGFYVSDSAEGGLFSKYCLYRMQLNGKTYAMYPIGFGSDGAKNPVYEGDRQISEIHISDTIINDMREYTLCVAENEDYLSGVLYCCAIFVIAHFHPGRKTTAGIRKVCTIDKNKLLLAKYDPEFMKKVK